MYIFSNFLKKCISLKRFRKNDLLNSIYTIIQEIFKNNFNYIKLLQKL